MSHENEPKLWIQASIIKPESQTHVTWKLKAMHMKRYAYESRLSISRAPVTIKSRDRKQQNKEMSKNINPKHDVDKQIGLYYQFSPITTC